MKDSVLDWIQYPVERSSWITMVSYCAPRNELHVIAEGKQHIYRDVPYGIVKGFASAASKGKYFHRHIKGKYVEA